MIKLQVRQGEQAGRTVESDAPLIGIGRNPENALQLPDYHLSGEHGQIFREDEHYVYRDLRSTNGSRVQRGDTVTDLDAASRREFALRDGDVLLLGDATAPVAIECRVQLEESDGAERIIAVRSLADLRDAAGKVERDPTGAVALYQAAKKLSPRRLELGEVLAALAEAVLDLVPKATHVTVLLSGEEDDRFVPVLARARPGRETDDAGPVKTSRAVLRRVLRDRAAVLVANAPEELGDSESIMGARIMSCIGVPLWDGDVIRGVLQCDNRASAGIFKERDLELMSLLAAQGVLAIENARLLARLRVAEEQLRGEVRYLKVREEKRLPGIIGESAAMKTIFAQLAKVVDTRATVCIEGETGTGKELVARAVHYQSKRRDKMFVAQNCAALPENLLESELFGYKKGAFTGADHDHKGLFEIASGGTMFLDEVTELPLGLQAKLLRVLQDGEVRPVGSTKSISVDVRLISATNKSMEAEVEAGRFRQDLYYRLKVFPLRLPPLRERREDIALLSQHFLQKYSTEMKKPVAGLSQEALDLILAYHWPGNVRELENEFQRLVIQCDPDAFVGPEHLSPQIRKVESLVGRIAPQKGTLRDMMEEVERWLLTEALREHGGNKTRTAEALGITREGLHKKLAKYGM
ncbi:MAG: sigma 54-interacting transcriptional regulator [Deltaproteobacteria bacterium]|nr:sigma 54-interacting transcriptional regulator [Deltaproteobacteria bacterium]